MKIDKKKYPWDRTQIKPKDGKVEINLRQYEEIRKNIQLIETIIDGATQQKKINRKRLMLALSKIRSIQSLYFPQLNYSLHYFKRGHKAGEQSLDRQNYPKYKKMRDLEKTDRMNEK